MTVASFKTRALKEPGTINITEETKEARHLHIIGVNKKTGVSQDANGKAHWSKMLMHADPDKEGDICVGDRAVYRPDYRQIAIDMANVSGNVTTEATDIDTQSANFPGTKDDGAAKPEGKKKMQSFSMLSDRIDQLHSQFAGITSQAYGRDYPAGPFESTELRTQTGDVLTQLESALEIGSAIDVVFGTGEFATVEPELIKDILETYELLHGTNKETMAEMLNTSLEMFTDAVDFVKKVKE